MNIFIDTGDVGQIAEYRQLGLITGVTTNPGICGECAVSSNPVELIKRIVAVMGDGYVFVQVMKLPRPGQTVGGGEIPGGPGAEYRGQGDHGQSGDQEYSPDGQGRFTGLGNGGQQRRASDSGRPVWGPLHDPLLRLAGRLLGIPYRTYRRRGRDLSSTALPNPDACLLSSRDRHQESGPGGGLGGPIVAGRPGAILPSRPDGSRRKRPRRCLAETVRRDVLVGLSLSPRRVRPHVASVLVRSVGSRNGAAASVR